MEELITKKVDDAITNLFINETNLKNSIRCQVERILTTGHLADRIKANML